MRDFVRASFNFLLFVFLLAGCAHNIYHFQKINSHNSYNYNRYNPSYRTSTRAVEYDEIGEIEEPLENELDEVTVKPNHDSLNDNEESISREEYYGY